MRAVLRRIAVCTAAKLRKATLFVYVAAAAVVITGLLRVVRLPRLLKMLDAQKHAFPPGGDTGEKRLASKAEKENLEIIRAIECICRQKFFVVRNNCLKKTLLLYYFLRKNGWAVEIRIGVNKNGGRLWGHSWLVLDNNPFREDEEFIKSYEVIYSSGVECEKEDQIQSL